MNRLRDRPHSTEDPIRVILVDDHPLFLDGLVRFIEAEPDIEVVGTAGTVAAAVALSEELRPDVLLLDVSLPGATGFEAASRVLAKLADVRVLMLSGHDEVQYQRTAYQIGADGYLSKACTQAELRAAIMAVCAGRLAFSHEVLAERGRGPGITPPTRRELEVLGHIRDGLSNKQIATELYVSERTIHYHVSNLLAKMQVGSRTQAIARARELGWLSDSV